jgi:hypothetical protein
MTLRQELFVIGLSVAAALVLAHLLEGITL